MLEGKVAPNPRKRRTQKQRSAATQERLLDATIDCIIDLGYAGTSTTEVCRRAGVSRGAQVHHFPTKASLVAAAIERLFTRRHDELRTSLDETLSLDAAFAAMWKIYSGPTLHAWMELVIAARTDPILRRQIAGVDARFFDEAMQTCRRLFGLEEADDATVAALTRTLLSVLDGLALNRMLVDDDTLHRASLSLFQQLLGGLQNN